MEGRSYLVENLVPAVALVLPPVALFAMWVRELGRDVPPAAVTAGNWCAGAVLIVLALVVIRRHR